MSVEENPTVESAALPGEDSMNAPEGVRSPEAGDEFAKQRELIREEIALAIERLASSTAQQREAQEEDRENLDELRRALAASREETEQLKRETARLRKEQYLRQTLSSLGVENLDLAVKAVREDVVDAGERKWVAVVDGEEVPAQQFLSEFLRRNRELLPARRMQGGGMPTSRPEVSGSVDLEEIRPGMDAATVKKVRDAIGRAMGVFPRVP